MDREPGEDDDSLLPWKVAEIDKAARRQARTDAIQNAPACPRCGLREGGEHECLPRADGFLRERNGNKSY